MKPNACPFCGLTCLCGVGAHIAHTEVCLDAQIMKVLFDSDSESGEGGET